MTAASCCNRKSETVPAGTSIAGVEIAAGGTVGAVGLPAVGGTFTTGGAADRVRASELLVIAVGLPAVGGTVTTGGAAGATGAVGGTAGLCATELVRCWHDACSGCFLTLFGESEEAEVFRADLAR